MAKITSRSIYDYLEGHTNNILANIKLKSKSYMEQVDYRKSKCSDCIEAGKCIICNCDSPARLYSGRTCNEDRFPDLMTDEEWEEFKKNNYE